MTIHRTLLISYLFISLASALLIALLLFVHFRDVLRHEIEKKLESQAVTIMQEIDTTLFERMQNMASWSHFDSMQEIKTRDIDKRLSQLLHELYVEYDGVYKKLYVINQDNQVISASQPHFIGTQLQASSPWLKVTLEQHSFNFDNLNKQESLNLSISIEDDFLNKPLGRLYANFNWQEIIRLLNNFIPENAQETIYYTLLTDNAGHVIATSSNLLNKIPHLFIMEKALFQQTNSGTFNYYATFLDQEVLVGYSDSKGYRKFRGLDWRVLILQSSNFAFAPVLNVWHVVLLFLCLTLFLGTLVSLWMSEKIARPIKLLEKTTRDFMAGKPTQFKPIKASTEVSALNTQFAEMINSLDQSRLDVARVAKLAVIGEMAASMAHEVRTPLGILRSSAQILHKEDHLSEIGQEMTEYILSETERLNELVTTLLECASPRPPRFSMYDVQKIIEHVLNLLSTKVEAKRITLELKPTHVSSYLYCDKDQLVQVFLNLIINAIQHVPDHGHITLSFQMENDMWVCKVCDDGSGILDIHKAAVFDPFYTQREEGIGLGLTVVQQIVMAHQGQIFITDNPQRGTCFHVQLPTYHQDQD